MAPQVTGVVKKGMTITEALGQLGNGAVLTGDFSEDQAFVQTCSNS